MNNSENQRRSFRLDVEIGFGEKIITEEELKRGIVRLRGKPDWSLTLRNSMAEIDEALNAVLMDLRRTAPRATSAIELVNRKVDLMFAAQQLGDRIKDLPIRHVNLSATGLAFVHTSEIELGTPMHCDLTLPSTGWGMEVYARVVSVREEGEGVFKICLDFEFIRDEDSEQLIRFNLQQQQQHLGLQR